MSDCLWPHGLQYARPPCPSPTPRVYLNSCPLSWWCHPTITFSVIPFSIFPSIRVFSSESVLHIRWPKYWNFSFSMSPSNEYSGLYGSCLFLFIFSWTWLQASFLPLALLKLFWSHVARTTIESLFALSIQSHFMQLTFSGVKLSVSFFNLTFRIPHSLALPYLTGLFLSLLLIFSQIRWSHSV